MLAAMSVRVIKTPQRGEYRTMYHPFIDKYFAKDFVTDPKEFVSWSDSPFYFSNITLNEDGSVGTYVAVLLTNEATFKNILNGKIREHEMPPWEAGEYGLPYLYWPTLIVENRTHAPYLIKSIFSEVAETARKWELLITHVYSIAFTKVSERLMRRYFFERVGTYRDGGHEYPVMLSKVADNPYLRAFIPVV